MESKIKKNDKKKMLIFSDIDGVITKKQKIWLQGASQKSNSDLVYIAKQYSDHDSYIIEKIRKQLVFISADNKVNKAWAAYRKVPFVFCDAYEDKWEHLWKYLYSINIYNIKIAYIGDSIPDLNCLLNADFSFISADASLLLMRRIKEDKSHKKIIQLTKNSGDGCLEETVLWLVDNGHFPKDILK